MNDLPSYSSIDTDDNNQTHRSVPFQFHGEAGAFFRIWIVNLCLTIITLGIYSAWAKVRSQQYFYGNTTLDGSSFEYTATPIQILKGRLLALGLFILYQLITALMPVLALPLMLAAALLLPWIITRAMMFRHYNTRYRGIRFGFDGSYLQAMLAYVLLPLASAFTAGILYPYAACLQQRWLANHSRFGTSAFSAALSAGSFYAIYLSALGLVITTLIMFFVLQFAVPTLIPFMPLILLPFYFMAYAYVRVKVINLTLNQAHLSTHRFHSTMETLPYLWILCSNTLAILFTFGLAYPWTRIRSARYRARCTSVLVTGDMDRFIQQTYADQQAFGEELGDALDLELGV